jgi:ABC-type Fe3+ transport system substrate-binding protein
MSFVRRMLALGARAYAIVLVLIVGGALIFRVAEPLAGRVLPEPDPIVISLLYSTEKEGWLQEVVTNFEATEPTIDGRPIEITLEKMGSREIYLSVLDDSRQPEIISPASSLQVALLESLSPAKFGSAVVRAADETMCRPVVQTPLVLVAWQERASVLWLNDPGPALWRDLHDVLVAPDGWAEYGQPEWGFVKFGHTDPLRSNSGFMALLLMTYDYFGKDSGLTSADILGNSDYQQWLLEVENSISEFGDSTGTYMQNIVAYGPSRYDLVAVYEATAIEQAENAVGRYGELRLFYPPTTVMSDHPFCVLEAEWVTAEERQAAQQFIGYLTSRPAQELALVKYGFRPGDATIPLDLTGSPFTRYTGFGLQTTLPPEVEVPPGDVLDTLLNFWQRNVTP